MGDWPATLGHGKIVQYGISPSNSLGTSTTSGTANAKSPWTQLTPLSSISAHGFFLQILSQGLNDNLVDVGIGESGAVKVIVSNVLYTCGSIADQLFFYAPVSIAANSKVWARHQSTGSSGDTIYVSALLCAHGFLGLRPVSKFVTFGAMTSDSGGTEVDPGGTANTKGAWTEIVASIAIKVRMLYVAIGNRDLATRATMSLFIDIGIGASGAEKVLMSNLYCLSEDGGDTWTPQMFGPFFTQVPSGTRLSARAQCSSATINERLFDVVLYGAP